MNINNNVMSFYKGAQHGDQVHKNGRKVTIEASMKNLSVIAMMASESRELRVKYGHKYTAEIYGDWFDGIYNALDAKGYYDNVK